MSKKAINNEYKYGFSDNVKSFIEVKKGISRDLVKEISLLKNEPNWMTTLRLKSFDEFKKIDNPKWGPDLKKYINFDNYTYYIKSTKKPENDWKKIPKVIKETFNRVGIIDAEKEFLAGVSTQYESEVVYHKLEKELEELGVIFTDTDSALKNYPDLFKQHFASIVPSGDNKYSALNTAFWSGGSFIYIPKNVKLSKPLQSYFRINAKNMGQFERTLIIADENSELHYIEGCTAPTYQNDLLHAAVVEIIVHKNAKVRYTTIQNWSDNVINLVTKRAFVYENGLMEWIDGNIGAHINMKYPSCILAGEYAKGYTLSIAIAKKNTIIQDTGARMIHLANNTKSNIISKSISYNGGEVNYRGKIFISKNVKNADAKSSCDTLLLDNISRSSTIPVNVCNSSDSKIDHEAKVYELNEEEIYYLTSRGIPKQEAIKMITLGFLETFSKELPMEYSVELNQLIKLDMEGSIG
ncbi:MAG: Fe-S cluster assembly protein SufB [Mycoplasma sp.]